MTRGFALSLEGLTVKRGGAVVIDRLSVDLPPGASLALVGESGSGKSTLLQAAAGLIPAAAGRVRWRDASAEGRRPRTSFVWQNLALLPWKRVRANLELPMRIAGMNEARIRERAEALAAELGIEDLLERWPHELSGGQRQRLALGRAMAADPDVLFMDEPFSALDAMRREQLQDVLAGIRARHGTSFVFVTHDIAEAVFLSTHILLLAAHPFRTLGLLENPAAQEPRDGARRDDPRFYETVRRVHAALARSRRGEAE